jgi:hypothetical protein
MVRLHTLYCTEKPKLRQQYLKGSSGRVGMAVLKNEMLLRGHVEDLYSAKLYVVSTTVDSYRWPSR